jgi:hypothetical protein
MHKIKRERSLVSRPNSSIEKKYPMKNLKPRSILISLVAALILYGCDDSADQETDDDVNVSEGGEATSGDGDISGDMAGDMASNSGTMMTPEGGENAANAGDMTAGMTAGEQSMIEPPCPEGQERIDGTCVPTDLEGALTPEMIEQMVGTYAVQMRIVMIQSVPILGELDNISRVFGLTEIRADGEGGVEMIERGCGARSSSGDTIQVVIPVAIPQSIEAPVTSLQVWEEDGVIHWTRPLVVAPIGIRLDDPVNDPLPMDPADPRIWDQDGDGAPGVTVNVMGFATGDLYIIQKQISSLNGIINDTGDLEGFVVDTSEQYTIGSTNPLLNQQIPSRPNPDQSLSTLRSVRMTEDVDCNWLLENQSELFPSEN